LWYNAPKKFPAGV